MEKYFEVDATSHPICDVFDTTLSNMVLEVLFADKRAWWTFDEIVGFMKKLGDFQEEDIDDAICHLVEKDLLIRGHYQAGTISLNHESYSVWALRLLCYAYFDDLNGSGYFESGILEFLRERMAH